MNVYLDASALVTRYVAERGSRETATLTADAEFVSTSVMSRAEVAAALAKAVRLGVLTADSGRKAQQAFTNQWADIGRVAVTETLLLHAEHLAWRHVLRGDDAVHLASALACQVMMGTAVTLATFDRQLWQAAQEAGMTVWPETMAS